MGQTEASGVRQPTHSQGVLGSQAEHRLLQDSRVEWLGDGGGVLLAKETSKDELTLLEERPASCLLLLLLQGARVWDASGAVVDLLGNETVLLAVEGQEVGGEACDVGGGHRGARDGVDGARASVPGGEDVQAWRKDIDALADVGEVGTRVGYGRGADRDGILGARLQGERTKQRLSSAQCCATGDIQRRRRTGE